MRFRVAILLLLGCNHESAESVAGPPLAVAPPSASASAAPELPVPPDFKDRAPPVTAQFVHLTTTPFKVEHVACEERIVAVAKGKATAAGESLGAGDVLITQGKGSYDLLGDGLAVFAIARGTVCDPPIAPMTKKVVRGAAAQELSWANGEMHAHLDAEGAVSPFAYVGRLDGTAPVAEHMHPGAWEVLAAVEGSGVFTLDGKSYKLQNEQVVVVPPDTKHAYSPSPGSHLRAIQLYSPPGPEQRFRALAAGGAPPATTAQVPPVAGPSPGTPAPSFHLIAVDGRTPIDSPTLKGKVIIVDFMATWCVPCRTAIPRLQALYAKYQSKGLEIVGIAANDPSEANDVKQWAAGLRAAFPIATDDARKTTLGAFKVETMPSTFVIDRTGTVKFVHKGYHDGESDEIEQEISGLL
jgi:peroxiredoxin/mannose-6-phosphate isomerase-like protein (cupin superfamily)